MAIFYDAVNTDTIILSFGEYNDEGPVPFAVKGNSPDPADVDKDSGIVKYELIQPPNPFAPLVDESNSDKSVRGVALFQVLSGEKLKVQIFHNKTASEVTGFTSAVKTHER